MQHDATTQRAMLEALGCQATVPGGSLFVQYHGPSKELDYSAGGMVITPPWCVAAAADIDELAMVGDQDDGTVITITESTELWRVLSIEPRTDGFVELTLGEVAP